MARPVHIIGAGFSGTSLALSLVDARYAGPIVLYDGRDEFSREQHWCAWGPLPRYLRPHIEHAWTEFQVLSEDRAVGRHTQGSPYVHLSAPRFFREAHRRLRREANVELRFGTPVDPDEAYEGYVLDATNQPCGEPALVHSFVGLVIRHERDVFGRAVRLMDFRVSEKQRVRYATVLPFGPREALIETTVLSKCLADREESLRLLRDYIEREFPGSYRVLSTEEGAIPLPDKPAPMGRDPWRARLGACGGAVRGASRYGLPRIVAQVDSLTKAIVKNKRLPHRRLPYVMQWLDHTLRDAVISRPSLGQAALMAIFGLPSEATTRYLMSKPTWGDLAAVMGAVPFDLFNAA